MLVMAQSLSIPDNEVLLDAASVTFALRQTPLPKELPDPPQAWTAPWAAYVRDYDIEWVTLSGAIDALRPFWLPITNPSDAPCTWEPGPWAWTPTV